jgi:hypothetical protein
MLQKGVAPPILSPSRRTFDGAGRMGSDMAKGPFPVGVGDKRLGGLVGAAAASPPQFGWS